jgi:hypothetical protein
LRIAYQFPHNGTLVAQTDPALSSRNSCRLQELDED